MMQTYPKPNQTVINHLLVPAARLKAADHSEPQPLRPKRQPAGAMHRTLRPEHRPLPSSRTAPLDYRELLRRNPALELVLSLGTDITWILDTRTGQYSFMSSNLTALLGYSPEQFTQGNQAFAESLIHPGDLPWLQALLRRTQDHLQALPPQQRLYHRVSFDCRCRKADGTYLQLLHQITVLLTDAQGAVTHLLGTATDITRWKDREGLVATVQPANGEAPEVFVSAGTNTSEEAGLSAKEALSPQTNLSKREREIVGLMAQGFSSKQIAHQLFISFHTVNTHRRNIIEKTGSKNTCQLVYVAMGRMAA